MSVKLDPDGDDKLLPDMDTADGAKSKEKPEGVPSVFDDAVSEKRVRTHTERGREQYELRISHFQNKLSSIWIKITDIIFKFGHTGSGDPTLKLEQELIETYLKYAEIANSYSTYLTQTNTAESRRELERHEAFVQMDKQKFDIVLKRIDDSAKRIDDSAKRIDDSASATDVKRRPKSHTSRSSHHSSRSSVSGTLNSVDVFKMKAKAEAARARAEFAERELTLLKQCADLEEESRIREAKAKREQFLLAAQIKLLKDQKEAAAAEAEVNALSSCSSDTQSDSRISARNLRQVQSDSAADRTKRYIADQAKFSYRDRKPEIRNADSMTSDLTKFLLKKDLLLSRLQKFNDKAENFAIWKASFKSIMTDLQTDCYEEMDLLVKWLGDESSKHAISIRAANANNPERGIMRIWERLDERYGSPEVVEFGLKAKLQNFPRIAAKDNSKLYDLTDILSEIESVKENPRYSVLLSYFDSSAGLTPIVNKLPYAIQQKWITHASRYKTEHSVSFPPFTVFVDFMRNISKVRNDPGLQYESVNRTAPSNHETNPGPRTKIRHTVLAQKTTAVNSDTPAGRSDVNSGCSIHPHTKFPHHLSKCRTFISKDLSDRRSYLKENNLCFRCLSPDHLSRNCKSSVKCDTCGSNYHMTLMHSDRPSTRVKQNGGEPTQLNLQSTEVLKPINVTTTCTNLCGTTFRGNSCGKIVPVDVFPKGRPDKSHRVYAILDDQSTNSLVKTELLDRLGFQGVPIPYSLESCAGEFNRQGRLADNLMIQSCCGETTFELPPVLECSSIPDERSEIPTPEIARSFDHLRDIADYIPPLDNDIDILLLIGRDLPEAHHVHEQIIGPRKTPFAQKLALGWVLVGDICLGKVQRPVKVNVNRTHIMPDGRGTIFEPCRNNLQLRKVQVSGSDDFGFVDDAHDRLGADGFVRTEHDEKIGMSVEDREFVKLMDSSFEKDESNHWVAPLPFHYPIPQFEDNRSDALKRALTLDAGLRRDPLKREHFMTFMDKIISSGACEVAPPRNQQDAYWYLPLFGVYHPKKRDSIRGVFDSSAVHDGVSLNSMLLSGPDLTNNLLGILLRFRKDQYAVLADIEQMFYQFRVRKDHRNYLRFFWYKDNNMDNPLIEYQMTVHVFGNSPSPAVATYGLRKTVEKSAREVKDFVIRNFYVDDGVVSLPEKDAAVDLLRRTKDVLQSEAGIRLHKFVSNDRDIMLAFPKQDLAKDLQVVDLRDNSMKLPMKSSLGIDWDLNTDSFVFTFQFEDRPFTRRGILSILNGIYDPIGFLSPIVITGKILLRDACPDGKNWDEPLTPSYRPIWENWKRSLLDIGSICVPRMYLPTSLSYVDSAEVHIYCDASEKAIAAAAYLVADHERSFILGKSKLAPVSGNTVPRLELCSAVLATELGQFIANHLDYIPNTVKYFTDSKVVLGYIRNKTRRFYTYVSNRVDRIHNSTTPSQWNYVVTSKNPAYVGTRYTLGDTADKEQVWLRGYLEHSVPDDDVTEIMDEFPLVCPDNDHEIRPYVMKTDVRTRLGCKRFECYSSWKRLVNSIAFWKYCAKRRSFKEPTNDYKTVDNFHSAEVTILQAVQSECFSQEKHNLLRGTPVSSGSPISALSPYLDESGLLRVGGMLNKISDVLGVEVTNPIILPKNHHVSVLLVRHYHESVKHQGRYLTEGSLRRHGYWIVGAKRLVSSVISKCVPCRTLRAKRSEQIMADLPLDRLTPGPPFTAVGVDTFGPWQVSTRKTRGGSAT